MVHTLFLKFDEPLDRSEFKDCLNLLRDKAAFGICESEIKLGPAKAHICGSDMVKWVPLDIKFNERGLCAISRCDSAAALERLVGNVKKHFTSEYTMQIIAE